MNAVMSGATIHLKMMDFLVKQKETDINKIKIN